jgi:hypothetical protein
MTKTVTGLFDHYSDATSAVDQLKAAGISDSDISIVSNNADGRYKDNDVAEDAGAGAVAGAVVGGAAGGLIGALTDSGVNERDAHVYAEGVRRGGTLVTAKVAEGRATEAEAILQRSNWVDLPTRRSAYEGQGWTGFDHASEPYSQAEIDAERARYAGRASSV